MKVGLLVLWNLAWVGVIIWAYNTQTPSPPTLPEWKQQFDLLRCPEQSNTTVSGIEIDMQALKLRCSYQPVKGK